MSTLSYLCHTCGDWISPTNHPWDKPQRVGIVTPHKNGRIYLEVTFVTGPTYQKSSV